MQRIFLALLVCYGLLCSAAFVGGVFVDDANSFALHFILGLCATVFTCFAHCVILTYFIITGKMIKQAVIKGHLDAGFIPTSQGLKGVTSALIVVAVLATLGAALVGVGADRPGGYGERGTWHATAECAAVLINAVAFYVIYLQIHRNQGLVAEVFARLNTRSIEVGTGVAPQRWAEHHGQQGHGQQDAGE